MKTLDFVLQSITGVERILEKPGTLAGKRPEDENRQVLQSLWKDNKRRKDETIEV